ncbi:hypothetical protein OSB04_004653 [Centaurea solstitialis]|uniref:Uncharacterized protein n=1 Tax=Centaurea solstitialis TaxID=347529 RepID=A0AA38TZ68_9ASTR|nr:hypothetical protein OSB04_004653 [Centaurea solstitialis]
MKTQKQEIMKDDDDKRVCFSGKMGAPLFSWPWQNLGSYKYILFGPFLGEFMYSRFYGNKQSEYDWCLHILILSSLRELCTNYGVHGITCFFLIEIVGYRQRVLISIKLTRSGIGFNEIYACFHHRDNFIILQAFVASIPFLIYPSFANFPIWETSGIVFCLLFHIGISEPLYYWLHRLLHSSYFFQQYHWLHHSSKVNHPFGGGHATFLEHLLLCVIIGIPIVGTTLIGYGSVIMFYGYILAFDFLRCMGHSNVEVVPHHIFETLSILKYLVYTPTGKYLNQLTCNSTNTDFFLVGKKAKVPEFVFLAHGVDVMSAMHVPFVFRSLSSFPFATKLILLPMWPFTLLVIFFMWAKSKAFLLTFCNLRGRLLQSWVVPRFGFMYFLPFAKDGINKQIEEAILTADKIGVKVLSLAALNKVLRVVHGNTLTAAVILNEIPQDVEEVFLTGATSKLGRAIALYLARRGVRVLMLTESTERFTSIQKEAPLQNQSLLVQVTKYQAAKHCKTWILGKWTLPREQSWAPPGTHFHQFVVPPVIEFRRDCTYSKLAAMKLPDDVQGLGACEYTMERGVVHACHAGGIVHLLEGWGHHEVGAIDVDRIDLVWEAALRHGFEPV